MSRWLQATVDAVPESFFRLVAEKATAGAAAAYEQASRTPTDDPTHGHRLGGTRYHERNKMLSESALATPGFELWPRMHKSHAYPLAAVPPYLVSHAKVEKWGDPIEAKDYKLDLAVCNPGPVGQLSLFPPDERGGEVFAVIVVQYHPPRGDQSVPLRIGFGVPTGDLSGWVWLATLEELFAAYRNREARLSDRARPTLKRVRRGENDGSRSQPDQDHQISTKRDHDSGG
jgi:hypothetical protein